MASVLLRITAFHRLWRHPPVIAQDASCIVERMVHIKQLIPQADVSEVVAKRPSLLCMEATQCMTGSCSDSPGMVSSNCALEREGLNAEGSLVEPPEGCPWGAPSSFSQSLQLTLQHLFFHPTATQQKQLVIHFTTAPPAVLGFLEISLGMPGISQSFPEDLTSIPRSCHGVRGDKRLLGLFPAVCSGDSSISPCTG
ncbi:MAG: hypothetical protein FRX49_03376 [Trebouxia sp. A1-2]|nr:MAG: hypothetical protein FRX49_03376 [Trebouxia sp. A1-2]